jgi:uncharacterized protein
MKNYIKFILRYRFWVFFSILIITCLGMLSLSNVLIYTTVQKVLFADSPKYEKYKQFSKEFTGDMLIIIGVENEELLKSENLDRFKRAVNELEKVKYVDKIDSLINAECIKKKDGFLGIEKYFDLLRYSPENQDEIINEIQNNSLYKGLLLSSDGKTTIVIIELSEGFHKHGAEELPFIVKSIIKCFTSAGFTAQQLHPSGFLVAISEMFEQTFHTLSSITPAVLIILLLITYILFSNTWPVIIVGVITLLSCIWTMGFAVFLDREVNVFIAMAPSVIIIIAFSDVIHLFNTYQLYIFKGLRKQEAIIESCSEVGLACVYTSLTTFMGFIAMSFVPVPSIRQYSIVLGIGVGVALLLAMTLTPILLQAAPAPILKKSQNPGIIDLFFNKLINWSCNSVLNWPRVIISVFIFLTGVFLYGVIHLNIDQNLVEKFDYDNHVRVSERFLKKHFHSTNVFDIIIDLGESGKLKDPQILVKIAAYQDKLESFPEVDRVVSIIDLISIIHQEVAPLEFVDNGLLLSNDLAAKYILMLKAFRRNQRTNGPRLEKLVNSDFSKIRLSIRIQNGNWRQSALFAETAANEAKHFFDSSVSVEPTGIIYLIGEFVDTLIDGQKRGIIFAYLIITVFMVIILGSFRNGIVAIIPNIFPLLALGGILGLLLEKVQSDTLFVALIAIGIGVDDTIHFLTRLKIESKGCDLSNAIRQSLKFSGKGIIMTTIILSLGFLPFCTSNYYLTKIYGTLLPMTLVMALLADILLLPALVKVGAIRLSRKN